MLVRLFWFLGLAFPLLLNCWWKFVRSLKNCLGVFRELIETVEFGVAFCEGLGRLQLLDYSRGRGRQLPKCFWNQRIVFIARAYVVDVGDGFVKDSRDVANEFGPRSRRQLAPAFRILLHLFGADCVCAAQREHPPIGGLDKNVDALVENLRVLYQVDLLRRQMLSLLKCLGGGRATDNENDGE